MSESSSYPRTYGAYLLLESLGQGGMSQVELARKTVDDARYVRFLVIKRIHTRHTAEPGFVRMFQDEARINGELQHENIAQVYDFGQVGDEWYIAMEYVPGLDLRGVIRRMEDRQERLPGRISLRIVCDVLKALQYAHSRVDTFGKPMNIVHRDVNPRNVMLSIRGEVKLIDFGVAKADTRNEQTKGDIIKGKFAYMAPEQIESGAEVDGRADLFAMALMLYELVAGEHPFAGLREIQIVHRVLAGQIPVLPDAPGDTDAVALRSVIRRALAMNPDERFIDADAFRSAIEQAAAPLGGLATNAELAAFIRELDPGRAEGISERLSAWRDLQVDKPTEEALETNEVETTEGRAVVPTPPPSPAPTPAPAVPTARAAPSPPSATGKKLIPAMLLGSGALITITAVVIATLWLQRQPQSAPSTASAPAAQTEVVPSTQPPRKKPSAGETKPDAGTPGRRKLTTKPQPKRSSSPPPKKKVQTAKPAAGSPAATATVDNTQATPPKSDPAEASPSETKRTDSPAPESTASGGSSAEPEVKAETAMLFVRSNPPGQEVRVDGTKVGQTPARIRVAVGSRTITLVDTATGQSETRSTTVTKTGTNLLDFSK